MAVTISKFQDSGGARSAGSRPGFIFSQPTDRHSQAPRNKGLY